LPDDTSPPTPELVTKRQGQTIVPRHVACPARPGAEGSPFYLRASQLQPNGQSDNIWVCEGCGMAVQNVLAVIEVEATVSELAAKAAAAMARPDNTLGPEALVYDPRADAFLIASTGRYIKQIAGVIEAAPPDPNDPITKWGVGSTAGRLNLLERLAVAAFMAGRWFAWARAPFHDQAVRPAPPRIVRPH
jgi:hypothetical protein